MSRILKGLKQALAFARGECRHDWTVVKKTNFHVVRECRKCKVRAHIPIPTNR